MLASDLIIDKAQNCVSRAIGQEVVVILPSIGEVKVLNDVGAFIWELADGKHTIAEMVDHICKEYAVERQRAEMDAVDFISTMIEKKMIIVIGKLE